ncbi:GNAT family N-acetyltransferase [Marivibrio halodurans]|uniref:GNAT family N-acetyltransferase n=1 Tax=Marivibrio halodurans TaxID=2039722 RepID=A0A8J7RYL7_9PROT|nr:GNAT family N-acetyltransferase [Marivibrio halodurans]MBP5856985.1 GNAT family N-acetyltransferase [Marivibrio halodurans]
MAVMILRPAKPDDLPLLRAWDNAPHVIAAFGAADRFDWHALMAEPRTTRELLIGEASGRPIGAAILADPMRTDPERWHAHGAGRRLVDLWVGPEADLGQGFGRGMMRLALARAFALGRVRAVIGAPLARNIRARGFLYDLGFGEFGRLPDREGVRILYEMPRARWARRRLKGTGAKT